MNYFSVFSGIGSCALALEPLNFKCSGFAEIDKFASAVLKERFDTPNYGDLNNIKGDEYFFNNVQLIIGGFPCQSFSRSGKRKGINDSRGTLFNELFRIYQESSAEWLIAENVPELLTSNEGKDFAYIINLVTGNNISEGKLGRCGVFKGERYSLCYRIFNSRYFGIPHDRRRVYIVIHSDWRKAVSVLFEPESLKGNNESYSKKIIPESIGASPIAFYAKRDLSSSRYDLSPTLTAGNFKNSHANSGSWIGVYHNQSWFRLTPEEWELLQGIPVGHTKIQWNNNIAPDGLRYRAIGNAFSVPVIHWIGNRLLN